MAMSWLTEAADFVTASVARPETRGPLLAVTGASFALGLALSSVLSKPHGWKVLPSPLKTLLPSLSDEEKKALPLPVDVFPGARDVSTPYGSIRVYEWGPEDGHKVLLVHGITTPCLALGGLAHALVDRGYRVMLFDLFGRGYSDAPSDLPQDARLFTTQILLALTSSPLSWTGAASGRFSLIGYSLGGGICAAFASHFPDMLSSVVLLAPSGLIRDSHISLQTRLLYSQNLTPESVLASLASMRLRAGPVITPKKKADANAALTQELSSDAQKQLLSRAYPTLTTQAAVSWQVRHHPGFVPAFMSSMRNGPILKQTQLDAWKRLGRILTQRRQQKEVIGLRHDKVLICCGVDDSIIIKDDLVADATAALEGNVQFRFFNAGHEFPSTKYEELAEQLVEFWAH
ncbi:hypothetical protein VTN77DRAFT_1614 [Rasamsonia byssochlamydoides]|uniref:uncharacterized protein n=1 Tax=Rasamsonia byssochlamydoides TaxID=89139 RepID=UPI00374381AB